MSTPLTVLILTLNEERNIARALGSVAGWAQEIWVVDSFSKDATLDVCRSFPGVRVTQHAFSSYGAQWNWALENLPIETEWVMKLDADEVVGEELRREIGHALACAPPGVVGFALWRKFVFMGRWLKHTVGKCYQVRVWRRGRARFEDREVNEHLLLEGRVVRLRAPLLHEDRKGISAWVWRHNRYSTMEAREQLRGLRGRPRPGGDRSVAFRRFVKDRIWPLVPCKPFVHFLHLFVFRLGFLDGRAGWTYARLRSFYYYLIEVKKREYALTGEVSSQDVVSPEGAARVPKPLAPLAGVGDETALAEPRKRADAAR